MKKIVVTMEEHEVKVLQTKLAAINQAQTVLQNSQNALFELLYVLCGPDVNLQEIRYDEADQSLYIEVPDEEKPKPKRKRSKKG